MVQGAPFADTLQVNSSKVLKIKGWLSHAGNDTSWANPEWRDADWDRDKKTTDLWINQGLPGKGMRWYRAYLRFAEDFDSLDRISLQGLLEPSAHEIYWDGRLLAANGKVGESAAREKPGKVLIIQGIPGHELGQGVHVLAIRVSNHQSFSGGLGEFYLGPLKALQNRLHSRLSILIFLMGIIFITGVFFIVNFMHRVIRTHVIFGLFCLGCCLQTLPVLVAAYHNVDFARYAIVNVLEIVGWSMMMMFLPGFFLSEFTALPKKGYGYLFALIATITLSRLMGVFEWGSAAFNRFSMQLNTLLGFAAVLFSLSVTAWAVYRRKEGGLYATSGLVCLFFGVLCSNVLRLEYAWTLGLTALILCLTSSLTRQFTRRSLSFQEANLKGARLEIELLKKNIQPHFLLSSLKSITDWLEKEPKVAARLVAALASELRMLLKVTSERVIPIAEEIQLCRTHLEVIALRHHRPLSLETRGIEDDWLLPPMVLHTLMDMGLEAAEDVQDPLCFTLEKAAGNALNLRMTHNGKPAPFWQAAEADTGMLYVQARLQEVFPHAWKLRVGFAGEEKTWTAELSLEKPAYAKARRPSSGA